MDFEDAITLTKLYSEEGSLYLLIGWQTKAFELYIYQNENVWKGRFSIKRLKSFSKNLQLSEDEYLTSIKRCLSEYRKDYLYDLRDGFFYWKRKANDTLIIEGFLPVESEISPNISRTDLLDIVLALNRHLNKKIESIKSGFNNIEKKYKKCLKDTEEFLNLKLEMEDALSKKFLNLLNLNKNEVNVIIHHTNSSFKSDSEMCYKKD